MGAWGLGLFQSDHDYDQVADFDKVAGLLALETKAIEDAKAKGMNVVPRAFCKTNNDINIHYSVFNHLCSHPDVVRKHLDSGILDEMLNRCESKLRSSYDGTYNLEGYSFILLGASAMTLGCQLTDSTLFLMKKHYKNVGLMRDALRQMDRALDGEKGYKNGVAWEFDSMGLHQTMEAGGPPMNDRIFPNQMNVEAPGSLFSADFMRSMSKKMSEKMSEAAENRFGYDVCGTCGEKEGEGGKVLLICARCKKRKYCGPKCQKAHWKLHKTVCKPPKERSENTED